MPTPIALIQGSSRGFGLSLSRLLLSEPARFAPSSKEALKIVATTSSGDVEKAKKAILEGLEEKKREEARERLDVVQLDVLKEDSVRKAAETVGERYGEGSLRLSMVLAGMLNPEKSITKVDFEQAKRTFELNTLGHLLYYKHFVPLLPAKSSESSLSRPSVLASLSARIGSISDNRLGGWYSYRSSKSALNAILVTLQRELDQRAYAPAITVAVHPGTVAGTGVSAAGGVKPKAAKGKGDGEPEGGKAQENEGEKKGVFTPDEAARKVLDVLEKQKEGGRFVDWKGETIPW